MFKVREETGSMKSTNKYHLRLDPKIFVLDLIENNAFIFDVSPKSTNQQGISSRSSKNPSIKQFSSSKNTLFNKYLIGYQWINIFLFWIVYVRLRWVVGV